MARITIGVERVTRRGAGVRIAALESDLNRGPLRQLIDRKGVQVLNAARLLAPVSRPVPRHPHSRVRQPPPGRLKRSLYARATTHMRLPAVEVGAKVPYLAYVLYPTVPHVITPRTRKALAFYWTKTGTFVVTQSVNHPGTRGQDFLSPALNAARL